MSTASQQDHERLIRSAINQIQRDGATQIKADHIPSFAKPAVIGGFVPDVTACYGSNMAIIEAESREGLTAQHTADQWRAFYREATRVHGYFIAVVAKADEAAASALLRKVCNSAQNIRLWAF